MFKDAVEAAPSEVNYNNPIPREFSNGVYDVDPDKQWENPCQCRSLCSTENYCGTLRSYWVTFHNTRETTVVYQILKCSY